MTTEKQDDVNEPELETIEEQNVTEVLPEPETPDEEPINFKNVVRLFEDDIKRRRLLRFQNEPKEDSDVDEDLQESSKNLGRNLNEPVREVLEDDEETADTDKNRENKDDKDDETDEENDEVEEEEEEEEETEMTEEEKEDMYRAVCEGDIAVLQNLLDKPNADINMTWFNENLLMVAMRTGQFRIAEFLIDIGIDCNYETDLIDVQHTDKFGTRFECYRKSCRQIAYEKELEFMVELIDLRNKHWFPYRKKTPRCPFSRRPFPPPVPPVPGEEEDLDEEELEDIADDHIDSVSVDKSAKNLKGKHSARSKTDSGLASGKLEGAYDELSSCSSNSFNRKQEGYDDGYETMTPLSSPYHSFAITEGTKERPGLLTRGTKASLSIKKHTNKVISERAYSKSATKRPVGRVNTVGSYARESRLWQTTQSKEEPVEDIPYLAQNRNKVITGKSTCDSRLKMRSQSASVNNNGRLILRPQCRQRPLSSPLSALSQVSKILGESSLLRPQKEQSFPSIKPTQRKTKDNMKINPWCHGNSSGVFTRLSDAKIKSNIRNSKFQIDKQLFERSRTYHELHT